MNPPSKVRDLVLAAALMLGVVAVVGDGQESRAEVPSSAEASRTSTTGARPATPEELELARFLDMMNGVDGTGDWELLERLPFLEILPALEETDE